MLLTLGLHKSSLVYIHSEHRILPPKSDTERQTRRDRKGHAWFVSLLAGYYLSQSTFLTEGAPTLSFFFDARSAAAVVGLAAAVAGGVAAEEDDQQADEQHSESSYGGCEQRSDCAYCTGR